MSSFGVQRPNFHRPGRLHKSRPLSSVIAFSAVPLVTHLMKQYDGLRDLKGSMKLSTLVLNKTISKSALPTRYLL
ncbi:hypothetical protein BJY04DRAFT_187224 [Aspergillus karnatakaensis]|uniref:uncharacterized protein n=1 Tax=Aspergillus karnatakaensis TaxID=1810916 RepID=UPI003CCCCF79